MKQKNGISLITLVITIIIIIILAGAVIFAIKQNNPISTANAAVFKSNLSEYRSELNTYKANKYLELSGTYDPSTLNVTGNAIKDVITSMKSEDVSKYEIQAGELVYVGTNDKEKEWINDVIGSSTPSTPSTPYTKANASVAEGNTSTPLTLNSTIDGQNPAYNNPVIPAGFFAVNTDVASWANVSTDWNNGLVIQDTAGNQFVWVPVDGTNVSYEKWCITGTAYNNSNISNDTFPESLNETTLESKYQGFYIARYEASFDYNNGSIRAKSTKSNEITSSTDWSTTRNATYNGYLWNFISYTDSKSYSENMATSYGYDTTKVGTNLVTGTEWDTTMKWIQNSEISVTNSISWGNYYNVTFIYEYPTEGTKLENTFTLLNTGAASRNRVKNIYDLAGNVEEWTNEKYSPNFVYRGGSYLYDFGSSVPAAFRHGGDASNTHKDLGFRLALYIK